jgi:AraC family transcriptional activator of mtrCDE
MDWLSQVLELIPVKGQIDIRCSFGAPWEVAEPPAAPGEMPYHLVLEGEAVVQLPGQAEDARLSAGDILLLPGGGDHLLRDRGDRPPKPAIARDRQNFVLKENNGEGPRFDMLCGRFHLDAVHAGFIKRYLPETLIVRSGGNASPDQLSDSVKHLAALVDLMRAEVDEDHLGGHAMLNAYSGALFTLVLRLASELENPPRGLLALAGQPRLAPALAMMIDRPEHPWTLPELASVCHMSRATLVRYFQDRLGRSPSDLLLDIRMTRAIAELEKSDLSTGAVGEMVGYQSEAAFQRVFKKHTGKTPAQWRRAARSNFRG